MMMLNHEGSKCTKCGVWIPVLGAPCIICPIGGTWTIGKGEFTHCKMVTVGKSEQKSVLIEIENELDRICDKMESGEPITEAELDYIFANESYMENGV